MQMRQVKNKMYINKYHSKYTWTKANRCSLWNATYTAQRNATVAKTFHYELNSARYISMYRYQSIKSYPLRMSNLIRVRMKKVLLNIHDQRNHIKYWTRNCEAFHGNLFEMFFRPISSANKCNHITKQEDPQKLHSSVPISCKLHSRDCFQGLSLYDILSPKS